MVLDSRRCIFFNWCQKSIPMRSTGVKRLAVVSDKPVFLVIFGSFGSLIHPPLSPKSTTTVQVWVMWGTSVHCCSFPLFLHLLYTYTHTHTHTHTEVSNVACD